LDRCIDIIKTGEKDKEERKKICSVKGLSKRGDGFGGR
jgi:hypothetical protein